MGSDAVRRHARALCCVRLCVCALLLTFEVACSPEQSRKDSKPQGEQNSPSGGSVSAQAGRSSGIGVGGSGTVTESGPNMIVPTLPAGSSKLGSAGVPAAASSSSNAGAAQSTGPNASAGTPGAVATAGASATGAAGSGGLTPGISMAYPPLDAAAIGTPMQVASGFSLAESPLWDPCTDRLMFTDVSAAGGGVINALGADGMVSEIMKGTQSTNGMAWDIDGSLVLAQMAGGLARRDPTGMVKPIDAGGLRLHTPDDVVVRSDGTIYLSDGNFCPAGALFGYDDALPVYTIKPGAMAWVNSGTVKGPNGIELSPDEQSLYLNGFGEGAIYKFDVMPDGTIMKPAKPFVTGLTDPDSLCLDAGGNLYVAVSAGIQVLRPDGSKVKLISIAGRAGACTKAGMTNCTFGGADGKTLYITGWTAIWKIDNMPVPGLDWLIGKQRAKCP